MDKGKKSGFVFIAVFLAACMTLGGLGNIAAKEGIYWVPFIVNIVVYGGFLYKIYKDSVESKRVAEPESKPSGKTRDPKTGRYVKSE